MRRIPASCRRWSARASRICPSTPTTSSGRAAALKLLVLPNVGALSDAQAAAIRRFVQRGGSLFATGETGLYDEWGDPRPDFALADLFGCHRTGDACTDACDAAAGRRRRDPGRCVRAEPERPHLSAAEPGNARACRRPARRRRAADHAATRHAVLRGFEETDILPFGGTLSPLTRRRDGGRAADVRAAVPDVSARNRLDARAKDRHSRA